MLYELTNYRSEVSFQTTILVMREWRKRGWNEDECREKTEEERGGTGCEVNLSKEERREKDGDKREGRKLELEERKMWRRKR